MENIIKKIFIFSFSPFDIDEPDGEPIEDKRGFIINFKSQDEFEKFENWTINDDDDTHNCWYDFLGDIESEYGVHDFGTAGYKEIVGYHSYEIRMQYRDEVMEKWRNHIIKNGYECGEILTGLSDDDNDYPMLDLSNALTKDRQEIHDRLMAAYSERENIG